MRNLFHIKSGVQIFIQDKSNLAILIHNITLFQRNSHLHSRVN